MDKHGLFLIRPAQDASTKKPAAPLPLPANIRKDVFLSALLEMPTTKRPPRSPLEWAAAGGFHLAIITVLILIPLYTTGTISLADYEDVPLIAPPPPPAPPAPAARAVASRPAISRPRLTYRVPKLNVRPSVSKKVSSDDGGATPPDLDGVVGGVSGGVIGGQPGGVLGGVLGGTQSAPPPPQPKQNRPAPKIVRVGSTLKAPRQTYSVQPEYPALARQARILGTVVVDAVIDEHGNVVQARALSGHPLLIPAALRAVLQWKYEPTSLNGQPISVELQVLVNFNGGGTQQ